VKISSKNKGRRTQQDAQKTRRKILQTALHLFAKNGYERVTFEMIARHIRLTKGAVYWHFKNKPNLLIELIKQQKIQEIKNLRQPENDTTSLDCFVSYFTQLACLIADRPNNRKCFQVLQKLSWPVADLIPEKNRLDQLENRLFSLIRDKLSVLQEKGVFRADANITLMSTVLESMWLGLINAKLKNHLKNDLALTVRFGFKAALGAIKQVRHGATVAGARRAL